MNFTIRMNDGKTYILENVKGVSTAPKDLLCFFSKVNESIICTVTRDTMNDFVYHRKDIWFTLDTIDRIYTYNAYNTDDMHERANINKAVSTCHPTPEFITIHGIKRNSCEILLRSSTIIRVYNDSEGDTVVQTDDSFIVTEESVKEIRRLLNA